MDCSSGPAARRTPRGGGGRKTLVGSDGPPPRAPPAMIWFVAIVLLIGVALALQAGLVAFAGYVLLGVYLLSRYLARQWVTNLSAGRKCDHSPREIGESTEVVLTLTNVGQLPIAWVLVEDLIPELSLRQRPARLGIKGKRLQVASL